MMARTAAARPVVLFDGACNLCSRTAAFIKRHDRSGHFRLLDETSDEGVNLLRRHGFDPERLTTIVLIEDGRVFVRSSAAIRLAIGLGGPWRLAALALALPRPIRDFAYDLVARNRYRLFGHMQECATQTMRGGEGSTYSSERTGCRGRSPRLLAPKHRRHVFVHHLTASGHKPAREGGVGR
jgi:predicted DCC family thiol-disulfide oxidoreductase YuxK